MNPLNSSVINSLTEYFPIEVNSPHAISIDPPFAGPVTNSSPFKNAALRRVSASYCTRRCVQTFADTTGFSLISSNLASDGRNPVYRQLRYPSKSSNLSSRASLFSTRIGWIPFVNFILTQTAMVIASVIAANASLLKCTFSVPKFA